MGNYYHKPTPEELDVDLNNLFNENLRRLCQVVDKEYLDNPEAFAECLWLLNKQVEKLGALKINKLIEDGYCKPKVDCRGLLVAVTAEAQQVGDREYWIVKAGQQIDPLADRSAPKVTVLSAGALDGNRAEVRVNLIPVVLEQHEDWGQRGLHLVCIDPFTSAVISAESFDLHTSSEMCEYALKAIPNYAIVAAAVKDTAYRKLSKKVIEYFESLGSCELVNLRHQESWAFVGGGIKRKDGKLEYQEMRREVTKRRATATKTFQEPIDEQAQYR